MLRLVAALRSDEMQGQAADVRALWVRAMEGLVEVVGQWGEHSQELKDRLEREGLLCAGWMRTTGVTLT